jgi:hypothetical protein
MIGWKLKLWRGAGAAAALSLAAACGGEGGAGGSGGEAGEGEGGERAATAPAGEAGEAARGESGGEAGEAGAASAYAGVSGEQLTALRLQHLKGFVLIATTVANENMPAEAAVLVQQGLLEVYDPAAAEFGSLNADIVRAAADSSLDRAQLVARLRDAEAEIDRASGALREVDHAALAARMVDIATGLYQNVNQADFVDPIEYQHSLGAALAARDALTKGAGELRGENAAAFTDAQTEVSRLVALWREPVAPERPATYRDVLAQGSRARLALSPFL